MKKIKKSVFFMILMLCVSVISSLTISANDDITNVVTISGVDLLVEKGGSLEYVIQNGQAVENQPEIIVGDIVYLDYYWEITTGSMPVAPGSTFTITLPNTGYIVVLPTPTFPLRDSITNEKIGEYKVEDGKVIVTLNEVGASKDHITEGFFRLKGKVEKDGENITIDSENNIFPPVTIKPNPGGSGGGSKPDYSGLPESSPVSDTFTKSGYQISHRNEIRWSMNVNYREMRHMVENNPVTTKNNMVLVDTLPDGLELVENSFHIMSPMCIPTTSNQMSGTAFTTAELNGVFPMVRPAVGQSYDDFYNEIRNTTTPKIGIYEKTIIIGFGNLPGNGITYADRFQGMNRINEKIDALLAQGSITQGQADQMKLVYGPNSTTNGQIVGYRVDFTTKVVEGTGDYENKAQLIYDTNTIEESTRTIHFTEISGGAIGGNNPTPTSITIPGTKIVSGDKDSSSIQDGQFTFSLLEDATNDVTGYTGFNNNAAVRADGSFDFGTLTFKKEGIYKFVASENPGNEIGYSYDNHTVEITVEVVKNINNELEATVTYLGSDGSTILQFENIYTNPSPAITAIFGTKIVEGDRDSTSIQDGQFTFLMQASDNNDTTGYTGFKEAVTVDRTGTIDFGTITFTKEGTYIFTICEKQEDAIGYKYDPNTITMTVEVTKNIENKLVASITFKKSDGTTEFIFVNRYTTPQQIVNPKPLVSINNTPTTSRPLTGDNIEIASYVLLGLASIISIIGLRNRKVKE